MNELLRERYEKLKERQKHFMVDYDELEEAVNETIDDNKGNEYLFESQFDMDYPTDVWCQQFEHTRHDSIIYIYGIGHYKYLKKLVHRVAFDAVIVYEPAIKRFANFLCENVEDVLDTEGLYFITGEKRYQQLRYTFENFLNYNNRPQLYIASIPNYTKCYETDYEKYCNMVITKCDNITFEKNTQILHEKMQSYNYLNNIFKLINESGIRELADVLEKYNNYPAVLVSAGPSLDKNVRLLKGYEGRAFVVAVDAALNTLKENGVVPDLVVTMDPKFEKINAFDDEEYSTLPMIVNMISGYKLLNNHRGRKFFDVQQDNLIGAIVQKYGKILPILGTGGSVANSAFSFLEYAGFKNIILIGQDLAYPDNRLHASGAFENEKDIDVASGKYYYVDDIYGEKVLTERNMDLYRIWFEDTIRNKENLNVIDATEGGALINGTEIMSLENALGQYCVFHRMNFRKLIDNAEYLFQDDERKEIERYVRNLYSTTNQAISRIEKGKNLYDELENLYENGEYGTNQFADKLNEIKELINYVDFDSQMAIFQMYAAKERTDVVDSIYDDFDNSEQEFHKLIDAGRKMLDAYVLAGDKIKIDWEGYCNEKGRDGHKKGTTKNFRR